MTQTIEMTAADGHPFEAWRSDPAGAAKGGVVILHAVYGRTSHMGDLCDQWAKAGYVAIAPALFDRSKRNCVYSYSPEGGAEGLKRYQALSEEEILADVEACRTSFQQGLPTISSGFCTGGTWAWVSAAKLSFDAQVTFYASQILDWLDLAPKCPSLMHYGDNDHVVSLDGVQKVQAARSEVDVQIYPGAGHAFFNPEQSRHDSEAAALAWSRSLDFLEKNLPR